MTTRRSLLFGLGSSLLAAPAIIRCADLMKVKALKPWVDLSAPDLSIRSTQRFLRGPYGSVTVARLGFDLSYKERERFTVGAGERIYVGDVITVRNGHAYRSTFDLDNWDGVAITSNVHGTAFGEDRRAPLSQEIMEGVWQDEADRKEWTRQRTEAMELLA